jgi:hypothetical protein
MNRAQAFIRCFAESGSVTKAAKAVGITRAMHYRRLDADPKYRAAFEVAKATWERNAVERAREVERVAFKRALEGVEEPVVYKGDFCYEPVLDDEGNVLRDENGKLLRGKLLTIRKWPESTVQFLLRGAFPEKYRERFDHKLSGEVSHKFKGTFEELLATYRDLVRASQEASE